MANLFSPTSIVDYRPAEKRLKSWLKAQGAFLVKTEGWAYWDFNNRPFWATWVKVSSKGGHGMWGLHIYDDGEILIVSELEED